MCAGPALAASRHLALVGLFEPRLLQELRFTLGAIDDKPVVALTLGAFDSNNRRNWLRSFIPMWLGSRNGPDAEQPQLRN